MYLKMEEALRLPPNLQSRPNEGQPSLVDPRLTHDGVHHFLLPSFFWTLYKLSVLDNRDFTVVIRTFGSDGANVVKALNAWAEGKHPTVPGVPSLTVDSGNFLRGKYVSDGSFICRREDGVGGEVKEAELIKRMEARHTTSPQALVVVDHYEHWRDQGFKPSAGKPLWLTLDDTDTQQIFFDDNIHNGNRIMSKPSCLLHMTIVIMNILMTPMEKEK